MIKCFETETIRCINGELLFSNDKLFVLVVCLNDIQNFVCLNDIQNFPMCFYDVIVELMNIYEIKSQITNQAIAGTSNYNLVRFSAISFFHQCLLQFYKIKTFGYDL